jgi:hypothetical protein
VCIEGRGERETKQQTALPGSESGLTMKKGGGIVREEQQNGITNERLAAVCVCMCARERESRCGHEKREVSNVKERIENKTNGRVLTTIAR